MATPDIEIHLLDHALHLVISRPNKRNALTGAMYAALDEALAEAEQNASVRTVIFSGAGENFCAGNDLGDFLASPAMDADVPVVRFIRRLATATKVLIAAVQGRAIGIGTTLLLHCDFVLAETGAEMRMPFVDLALVPEAGSSLLLPNLIGQRRAAELLLLGETLGAEQAERLGLVNRVVGRGEALPAAFALAEQLAQKPAGALVATKQLMKSSSNDLLERIEAENRAFAAQLKTAEFRAKVAEFFQSRAVR